MRLIDASYEIIEQEPNILGVYKQIEKAARTAYKSEDKITEGSAQRMVEALCKSNHGACLEHGTIYLKCDDMGPDEYGRVNCMFPLKGTYGSNPYSKIVYNYWEQTPNSIQKEFCKTIPRTTVYITTNARVIFENGWEEDLQYMCEPTEFHEKRITVKFVTSIGICREILRHRRMSFLNESTRYCNYSKGKFNSELTFIIPQWIHNVNPSLNISDEKTVRALSCEDRAVHTWMNLLTQVEDDYLYLTTVDEHYVLKAEEARGILPLDLKSELIVTGFVSDWIHFFKLRSHIAATGKPHPDIQKLADPLMQEFIDRGYCTYEQIETT